MNLSFKELLSSYGLSQSEFSRKYDVPLRTVQNWVRGDHVPPPYVLGWLQDSLTLRSLSSDLAQPPLPLVSGGLAEP